MSKAYFLLGNQYLRYDLEIDAADDGYPKPMTAGWSGLEGTGFENGAQAAVDLGAGTVYLFNGDSYLGIKQANNTVEGVGSIAEDWGGFADVGFTSDIDAALNYGDGIVYVFRGDSYIKYSIADDTVDPQGVRSISDGWAGFGDAGFGDGIEAALNPGNGRVHFFKGGAWMDFLQEDETFEVKSASEWTGLDEAGFGGGVDAAWVKLEGGVPDTPPQPPPTPTGAVGPGDHVWYFNGMTSTALKIPQADWFPGFTSATDYLGHGDEIFQFVIHSDGTIFRGRPHMRTREGSYAWLNHNPGNLTGVTGGPDYGQYPGKFNWHNFLVFPSREVGFTAIGKFLRAPKYLNLSIMDAFAIYAPASDGNDPVAYATSVAAAAGVPTSFVIRDLDDNQMFNVQTKIAEHEGAKPGVVLTRDSPELPDAVRALLG